MFILLVCIIWVTVAVTHPQVPPLLAPTIQQHNNLTLGRLVVPLVCRNNATSDGRGPAASGAPGCKRGVRAGLPLGANTNAKAPAWRNKGRVGPTR